MLSDPVILSRNRQYGVTDLGAAITALRRGSQSILYICFGSRAKLPAFLPARVGAEGISSFFSQHTCNEYCRSRWSLPRNRTPYFQRQQGTSMAQWRPAAPTRGSRPAMTAAAAYGQQQPQQQQDYPYDDEDDDDDDYTSNDDMPEDYPDTPERGWPEEGRPEEDDYGHSDESHEPNGSEGSSDESDY